MPEKIQEAYNEWLLKFGFREVHVFDAMGYALRGRITTCKMKPFGEDGSAAWYTLKQPHEIY